MEEGRLGAVRIPDDDFHEVGDPRLVETERTLAGLEPRRDSARPTIRRDQPGASIGAVRDPEVSCSRSSGRAGA
jgi:hypothetical protein